MLGLYKSDFIVTREIQFGSTMLYKKFRTANMQYPCLTIRGGTRYIFVLLSSILVPPHFKVLYTIFMTLVQLKNIESPEYSSCLSCSGSFYKYPVLCETLYCKTNLLYIY